MADIRGHEIPSANIHKEDQLHHNLFLKHVFEQPHRLNNEYLMHEKKLPTLNLFDRKENDEGTKMPLIFNPADVDIVSIGPNGVTHSNPKYRDQFSQMPDIVPLDSVPPVFGKGRSLEEHIQNQDPKTLMLDEVTHPAEKK